VIVASRNQADIFNALLFDCIMSYSASIPYHAADIHSLSPPGHLIGSVQAVKIKALSWTSDSLSDLKATISGFDDARMTAQDLAFFLVSHGFDATPKGSFVEVDLSGHTFKLTPNGSALGLAWITAITC
jgi:hypothetical protein